MNTIRTTLAFSIKRCSNKPGVQSLIYVVAILTLLLFSIRPCKAGQAVSTEEIIVIQAGRVITVSGEEFSPGTIVIEDGIITAVGSNIEFPPSAKTIKAKRETVIPGFIHPRTRYGLDSYNRSGVNGDKSASTEVYLSWMDFSDLLHSGYTTVCFIPPGKDITGMASVYHTAGPDDTKLLKEDAYLNVVTRWLSNDKKTIRNALKKAREEIEKVEKARKEWEEKQKEKKEEGEKKTEEKVEEDDEKEEKSSRPDQIDNGEDQDKPTETKEAESKEDEEFKPPKIDPKYQPLVDLIQHKEGASMMMQLTKASDLRHLQDVLKPYDDLSHSLYLASSRSTDYHYVVDALGKQKASVVIRPWIHYLPLTTFRYNLVAKLIDAGCEVSIIPWLESREELQNVRARLSDLIRSGLSRENALKTLTLYPARVIGMGDRLGSIEKDKEADLAFFNGDPLDPHTKLNRVMIHGEMIWTAEEK